MFTIYRSPKGLTEEVIVLHKRRLLRGSIYIVILLIILNIIVSFYFYHLAIARNVKEFLQDNDDLEVSAEAMEVFLQGDWRDWVDRQPFEQWEITSDDDLKLQGYYLPPKKKSNKVVLMVHGYLGHAMDMGLYAEHYYEAWDYHIFTADARGHGASEGDYIGFGWHDRLDTLQWIDEIIENLGEDVEIVLHGLSMGAATVLMTSGEELPTQVRAIVADSPYTSVHDMFAYQMKRMFKLPSFPILNTTSLVTQLRAGYSLKDASALKQVQQADVPILYMHGNSDTFVPTELAKKLYDHTASEAYIELYDGASHGEAIVLHREKYLSNLEHFLKKYMSD